MTIRHDRLSSRVVAILRDADRHIRSFAPGDYHRMYDFLRATMGKIVPVDAFYVGFYLGDLKIAYPYTFDQQEYEAPGVHTYGPHGLGAWIRQQKKTYTYAWDNGRLLNSGHAFGDVSRLSRDAVTVPLLHKTEAGSQAIGLASMQSYEAGVYDAKAVWAFEWLCDGVVAVLRLEHEAAVRLRELETPDAGPIALGPSFTDVVVELCDKLEVIRRAVAELRTTMEAGDDAREQAGELDHLCTRVQQETFAVLTKPPVDAVEPLSLLTPREREIAELLDSTVTNRQIAEMLSISVGTVKRHVTNIFKKFKVRRRSEVAAKLRPFR